MINNRLSKNVQGNSRDCNFEFLRIICMFFILIHHFLLHGLNVIGNVNNVSVEWITFGNLINAFCFIGVNCFVLISGYYSIQLKIKSLIKLYLQCAFYGFALYIVHLYLDNASFGKSVIFSSIFVFSHYQGWWFISCYIILCFVAPLLNFAIKSMTQKQYFFVLFCFTIINIYFGFGWNGDYNPDGFNVSQFIYLYLIGRYINIHLNWNAINLKKLRTNAIVSYVLLSVLVGLISILETYLNTGYTLLDTHKYNNPLLILSSISFLLIFRTFSFKSNLINWIASSSLAVYLITDNIFVRNHFYLLVKNIYTQLVTIFYSSVAWLLLCVFAVGVYLLCVLIDKVRIFITMPFENYLSFLISKIWNIFILKFNRLV